jgi:hypothetical protein
LNGTGRAGSARRIDRNNLRGPFGDGGTRDKRYRARNNDKKTPHELPSAQTDNIGMAGISLVEQIEETT